MFIKRILRVLALLIAGTLCFGAVAACQPKPDDRPETPTEEPEPTPEPRSIDGETPMAKSVVYAASLENGIQGVYDTPERLGFTVTNENSQYKIGLKGEALKGLNEIRTASGKTLISGGMTGFIVKADGGVFDSVSGSSTARVNTNRMGIFYYEVNIRDLVFSPDESAVDLSKYDKEKALSIPATAAPHGNMVKNVSWKDGVLTGTIEDPTDPYVCLDFSDSIDGCNVVLFDLTTSGSDAGGQLFYVFTGGHAGSFNQDDSKTFPFTGGSKQTVAIYVADFEESSNGYLSALRFDINGKAGDTFKIENIRLAHINELGSVNCGYEQTLHSYSDKMHNELRVIFDTKSSDYKEFGYRYVIPAGTVADFYALKQDGSDFTGEDGDFELSEFQCVGFEIKESGMLGLIACDDGMTHTRLSKNGGKYVVEFYIDVTGNHRKGSDANFGHRILTAEAKDFKNLKKECYFERNPLAYEVTEQHGSHSKLKVLGYNTTNGAYEVSVAGIDFTNAYKKKNVNKYFGGTLKVTASSDDRKIYFCSHGANGCLEAAVLLDESKTLVPIQPEVCKNFAGEHEERYYDPNDTQYGDTVYPLVVEKGKDLTYTMLNVYQNWGVNRLKQLSSISFHIGYYHLSTGVTESNCIAPYFVFGRDGWTLPDFRGCSGVMWSSQPQFNSVGRLRFVSYNKSGQTYQSEYIGSDIRSVGPVYADVAYSYRTYDGAFDYSLRHTEFPQNDENRTYYTLEAKCVNDVTYKDARNSFTLFSFDPRFQCMKTTSYKAEDGSIKEITNKVNKTSEPEVYKLCKDSPFFSLYDYSLQNNNDVENFAYIVRSYKATVGGKDFDGCLVMRNSVIKDGAFLNLVEIGLDADKLEFKKGDTIKIVFVLLPYGVTEQKDDPNVHYVIEDTVDNPWRILECEKGTVVEDDYLAIVDAENDEAVFTVTGSRNSNAVRVNGFSKLTRPKVQEKINGEWVDITLNVEEFDGYQVNYTKDGYFSYSFIVDMEIFTDQRTFKVTCG